MLIYRIEDPNTHKGIFSSGIADKAKISTVTNNRNPEPEDDGINVISMEDIQFGKKQLIFNSKKAKKVKETNISNI